MSLGMDPYVKLVKSRSLNGQRLSSYVPVEMQVESDHHSSFACSQSTIETSEQYVKSVQS